MRRTTVLRARRRRYASPGGFALIVGQSWAPTNSMRHPGNHPPRLPHQCCFHGAGIAGYLDHPSEFRKISSNRTESPNPVNLLFRPGTHRPASTDG